MFHYFYEGNASKEDIEAITLFTIVTVGIQSGKLNILAPHLKEGD